MSTSKTIAHEPSSLDNSIESESSRPFYSTRSLPTTTGTSNANTPRITFAPLPLIEPRRRRSASHIKLGVAARSRLMRQQLPVLENKVGDPCKPTERQRGGEEGGALQKLPLDGEVCQDEEIKTKARSSRLTNPDMKFLDIMKGAWRRVVQTQTQTLSPSSVNNRSAGGGGDVGLDQECDKQLSFEKKHEMKSDLERQRQYSHDENMPSEDDALSPLDNRWIDSPQIQETSAGS